MFTEFFFKVERAQEDANVSSPNFGANKRERSHSDFMRRVMSPIQADDNNRKPVRGLVAAVQPMIEEEKKEVTGLDEATPSVSKSKQQGLKFVWIDVQSPNNQRL